MVFSSIPDILAGFGIKRVDNKDRWVYYGDMRNENNNTNGSERMNDSHKPVTDLCLAKFPVGIEDKDGDRVTVTSLRWVGRTCYCVCEGQDWWLRACHVRKIEG